jgi:pimeloyl-ACP methyl ester carboxylesterase
MDYPIRTRGHWITDGGRPLLGWLTTPEDRSSESGVLILPPVGYAYWSVHRTLRVIAERLAGSGHLAFRLDYESTGDSSGDQWDRDVVNAWQDSVLRAAAELRGLGGTRLTLIGPQLGGTFALLEGDAAEADAVVAWAPVVSGRRWAREIRARSVEVPDVAVAGSEGAMVLAGTVFTGQTLADLASLDAAAIPARPAPRVLLVDESPQAALVAQLEGLGVEVDHRPIPGGESALEWAAEDAIVPEAIVAAICSWVGEAKPNDGQLPASRAAAPIDWAGAELTETVVELGAQRLVGIRTELSEAETVADEAATVVFLNSGAEQHTGPGRAWVEYARALAVRGHRCFRIDYRGWGESPDDGHAPARLYEPHCEQDTVSIVRSLRELGHERIVLVGLCASAWMALRAVLTEPVEGVVALNPQMYWRQGDPVEALIMDTHTRRTAERRRHAIGARIGAWTALDLAGHRGWAGRWLDDLGRLETPIVMVFAEGDDGIDFLRTRFGRRLQHATTPGTVRVVEIPEIDHAMHRAWLRPTMIEVLAEQIGIICGTAAPSTHHTPVAAGRPGGNG